MDMRMPVLDGYEATRRIRRASFGSDVAIIGVTASAFSEMRQGVFDAGVDEFVGKPFHESELFEKIGKLLNLRFVYETPTGATLEEDAVLPETLSTLPEDIVARLRDAATAADFDTVVELAREIEGSDKNLAEALRTLAERFDAEAILKSLSRGGA
jgi:CheY-like chemotaxis protein